MTSSSFSVSSRTTAMNHDTFLEKSPKKFRSTNSWLENKKLQNALDESRALLEEERVEKLGQLSQAEWISSIKLAKVTKQVGKHWMTMGHTYRGDVVLYPEEALFLLETNSIEINYGGMPMSLQQAYSVLLGPESDCTLDEYRTYAHLTRYGYRVRRHNPHSLAIIQEDPLEVDVVGIIRKRKSSGNVKSEKNIEVEDSIEVLEQEKTDNPAKSSFSESAECHSSTSGNKTAVEVPPSDDDDIKFIKVIDSSKKRKVASTIIINDDLEITCYAEESAKQPNLPEIDKTALHTHTNENLKKENKTSDIFGASSSNAKLALNKPSRGMYDNKPLASLSGDTELPEHSPLSNAKNKRRESSAREENALKDQKSPTNKPKTVNEDIIVLSDDETKEDNKQSKELLRFYKEISLIELIDISEDDEGEKAASRATVKTVNGKDRRVDEKYDFWGALGRIPTLENGRLMITIPSPPSNLIPRNIHPVKDEYKIDLMTSVEGQNEEGSVSDRPAQETQRQMYENNNFSQQCQQHQNQRQQQQNQRQQQQNQRQQQQNQRQLQQHQQQQNQRQLQQNQLQYQQQQHQQLQHQQLQQYHQQQQQLFHPQDTPSFSHTQTVATSMQNMWNSWNPWQNRFRNYQRSMGNGYQTNSFQGNPNQTNTGRSPWVSLVYSQRPNNYSITTQFQAWFPSNSSSHFQSAHHMSYAQHTSHFNFSDHGNRQQPWKRYSNFTNGQNNSMHWQQACAPRRGNGFSRRDGMNAYHRRRFYGRTSRCVSNESTNKYHSVVPKMPDARSWSEVKTSGDKQKSIESSERFHSDTKKDILPLLKPADSISIGAVNSKLQITNSAKFNCYDGSDKNQGSLSIKFDLYLPNSNFRKSCPGIPRYRLSIVKSDNTIPKLEDNLYLMKNLNDEVPLLYAVSFPDTINFFSFSNVELPVQLSKSS